jgi:hypothetical protein
MRCSCMQGIIGSALGMVGKAWSTGALCVVQNAETLPQCLHPRNKLEGGVMSTFDVELDAR